jgi:hypothetical protein
MGLESIDRIESGGAVIEEFGAPRIRVLRRMTQKQASTGH